MAYQCEIKDQPVQPVLSMRGRTPVKDLSQLLGRAYGAVAQYLGTLGEAPAGAPFAVYYNMDMEDLDIEAGFPVAKVLPGKGEVNANEIPAGEVATCIHTGSYETIGTAYEVLDQYLKEQGREATGIAYEFYLNDPMEVPPEELKTQIVLPLKAD